MDLHWTSVGLFYTGITMSWYVLTPSAAAVLKLMWDITHYLLWWSLIQPPQQHTFIELLFLWWRTKGLKEVVLQKTVLKNFPKFTEKDLPPSLFSINFQAVGLQFYQRDLGTSVFQWILWTFTAQVFSRTLLED